MAAEERPELEALLRFLRDRRGFDFTGYKRPTLQRRILKRMTEVGAEDHEAYQDLLEADPREFIELFNTILINVTGFFRDPDAWRHLAEEVVPRLVADVPEDRAIRVWSAGCASGEEAYTLVMVLAEALGEQAFRERVKVYATDVDDDALATARAATYRRDQLDAVPAALRGRYFEETSAGWCFRPDLRRCVIFGRNDLVQDAPISRVDLLVSRNVLMYFTAETQARVLERFNFALSDEGRLFLGTSEMLIAHADLFVPDDASHRVFRRVQRAGLREWGARNGPRQAPPAASHRGDLRADAASASPIPQVIVDRPGFVVDINAGAHELLALGPGDVGRPFQDLEISYRLGDLRSAIERAYADGTTVRLEGVTWPPGADDRYFDVHVTPVPGDRGQAVGAAIALSDVTALVRLRADHDRARRDLETAYEELQSTVEELETTNEELQSTVEELETTNEELQSSNEELETMNEELQSTNDELEAMNEDQRLRARELDTVNVFLEGILRSLGVGVVVLDPDGRIEIWNASSEALWGLPADEVHGRPLLTLRFGLPVERLADPLQRALAADGDATNLEIEAVDGRGRTFTCLLRVLPLVTATGDRRGAIVLMAERTSEDGLPLVTRTVRV
ncbi:CheR family methyltransferase [Patulibacter sp. S7RM1-6]